MKKFEQELKQKAHLNKIKNAKKTVSAANKNLNRMTTIKNDQAQVLLSLYEKKRFDSIPAYKLLRTAGLQQYTRGFIERGYGVKLGILSALSEKDKNKLYEDIKVLPGHAVKLDKLIETISKHSYIDFDDDMSSNYSNLDKPASEGGAIGGSDPSIGEDTTPKQRTAGSYRGSKLQEKLSLDVNKLKFNDPEYEKQLERVINQYTPNPNTNEKVKDKRANVFREDSGGSSSRGGKNTEKITINFNKLKMLEEKEFETEKNLQKVANEYTPLGDDKDKKKKTFQQKVLQKKTPNVLNSNEPARKYSKTKYIPNTKNQPPAADFKKKTSIINSALQNKPTTKKIDNQKTKQPSTISTMSKIKNINLGIETTQQDNTTKIMQINLQLDKVRALNRSFDGAVMSSTIANIDIEELVFAFSGYVFANVVAAPEPTWVADETTTPANESTGENQRYAMGMEESIEDQVGNILRESYLHPLYREEEPIDENIESGEQQQQYGHDANSQTQYLANSQGQQQDNQQPQPPHNQFLDPSDPNQQPLKQSTVSSFMGGQSHHFGLASPLEIFNESEPSELDYYKPTVDSIANFIKNVVLTAKMEREIPIMAAHYLRVFIGKTGLPFTSLNYKRILVTLLLLASKIWDDESFQSPSFSKTFPQYTTVMLNQMEKEVLKALDYKLKLDKKQYAQIYFQLRKYARKNLRSCQNKKLNLNRIRELQQGIKKDYRTNYLDKRNSF